MHWKTYTLYLSQNVIIIIFLFYEWKQNGHNVPFLESVSLENRNRKAMDFDESL